MLEKYGVGDRKTLLLKELEEVRENLKAKTASHVPEELLQREKDILEALEGLDD